MFSCCSVAKSCLNVCDPMDYSMPDSSVYTISWGLLKFMSIELVMLWNHFLFCLPLFLPPSVFPSMRVFSSGPTLCIRWSKYWSFNFSNSPSNEHSELISFWIYWFYFLEVQGTLKSFLQPHSSKASILRYSGF